MPRPSPGTPENPLPRRAARVLLIDAKDRVLLFLGKDPGRPGFTYWFTAGGGLDPGETPVEGAARELLEETGLAVSPDAFGPAVHHETMSYPYDGRWYRQEQDFFLLRVESWEVSISGFDEEERASIEGHRWWSVEELEVTTERYYPADLAGLVREMVDR